MKLLPLVFYLLVFEPEGAKIKAAAITVALAFATFENVCYLIPNGADRFSFIFFRGFGTGARHVLCGLIVGGGLAYAWPVSYTHLRTATAPITPIQRTPPATPTRTIPAIIRTTQGITP